MRCLTYRRRLPASYRSELEVSSHAGRMQLHEDYYVGDI